MARLLIVDGYNLLLGTPRYSHVADRDIDAARSALVSDVAVHAHGDSEAIVVFDGASNPESTGEPHDAAGVTVIFSPYGRDADSVIEQIVAARRAKGDEVTLVTSDAETQWLALGHGARRISSAEFEREVHEVTGQWREHSPKGSSKHPVENRLDRATREALSRWAKGE